MTDVSDYLNSIRRNNPGLSEYWPGVKKTTGSAKYIPPSTADVTLMNDVDLAFEYRECKESGQCGARLTELEQETVKREEAKGPPKEEPVATSIKRGCLPCATGHLTTCAGLLNEAVRFSRTEGIASDQVLDDTNACISELNAMERIDMSPERIAALPPEEKKLALEVLALSKETRYALEAMRTPEDLEKVTVNLQPRQREILKKWFRYKFSMMTPSDKQKIVAEAMDKIKKEGDAHA